MTDPFANPFSGMDDIFSGLFRFPLDTPYSEMKPHEQAFYLAHQARTLAARIRGNQKDN